MALRHCCNDAHGADLSAKQIHLVPLSKDDAIYMTRNNFTNVSVFSVKQQV